MGRSKARRKATPSKNNSDENLCAPKRKYRRISLPLPQRPSLVGRAMVCGLGDMGQLGLGEAHTEQKYPALVNSIENVVDVCAGGMHSIILTDDGRVYSFGCNDDGALGRDGSELEPGLVELPAKALRISAGDSHTATLLEDGSVFAWGSFRDSHGNMGFTTEGIQRFPIELLPGFQCCDIASGTDHLVILTCKGKVYTLGCAEQGQLGRVSMTAVTSNTRRGTEELLKPGEVVIKYRKKIGAIWATKYCTFLRELDSDTVWAFGLNNYKQLVHPKDENLVIKPVKTSIEKVKQISGGQHHTLVLKEDGTCLAIGRVEYGRLGVGEVPADDSKLLTIEELTKKEIVALSCGEAQSFAITADGKIYSWGMGCNYQLGNGSDEDLITPVLLQIKQTDGKRILRVSSGGQHTIFLVEKEMPSPTEPETTSTLEIATKNSKDTSQKEENSKGGETKLIEAGEAADGDENIQVGSSN